MPEIKLEKVISVSSEDKKFPVSNLLGAPGSGKWKSATAGEKQLSVVLQFENPARISSIHVGNEGSAFVEVLVGKQSSDQDWKVILVTSSLMMPAEARSNTNTQKVRLFSSDDLSKSCIDEMWDKVKVVCVQPFNKSQPYGLSFISFRTDDETKPADSAEARPSSSQKLGAFTLADDTDSDDMSRKPTGGSMFSQRDRLKADLPPATAAAAVRAAAREADKKVGVTQESKTKTAPASKPSVDRQSTSSSSTNQKKNETSKPSNKRALSPANKDSPKSKTPKTEDKKTKPATNDKNSTSASANAGDDSAASSITVPFKELLKGVVFSLSGFKNPKRGDLREKAMQMGAKYSPDWDKKCTHLVCAFESTPKFSQVNGKGYIVKEDWVLDSHSGKKKLPWRDYRLGRAKSPVRAKDDDQREKDEEERRRKAAESKRTPATKREDEDTDIDSDAEVKPSAATIRQTPEDDLQSTQVDSDATEIDTDDEIAAHLAKAADKSTDDKTDQSVSTKNDGKGKSPANGKRAVTKNSNNGATTSNPLTTKRPLPELPDYLLDKVFFLYGTLTDRRSVYRYIHAYGGQVEEYMCDEVQYVITDDTWDDNFDSALTDNPNLTFVKSKWISEIHTKQKYIPHQKYAIVPE